MNTLRIADCGLRIDGAAVQSAIGNPQSAIAVALLLAACQPAARRALVLDLALGDPALLEGTATPWADAGYAVEYRRFYPHLTHADLERYGVVLILGGRTPERWSDALGTGDLALLTAWVPRGGVLVFGYAGDGEGSADRWVINRWLAGMGTGIVIGDALLQDTTRAPMDAPAPHPPARSLPGTLGLASGAVFPAGRNHPLRVRRAAQALARTTATAFVRQGDTAAVPRGGAAVVAATRVGRGLVVIASRHLLGSLGPELRASTLSPLAQDSLEVTRRFLAALARWTRRPAEWAAVPGAHRPAPITLPGPIRPLAVRAPPAAAPTGAEAIPLPPIRDAGGVAAPRDLPEWLTHQGLHVGWSRATVARPASLDSLLAFSDAAGLNVLASPMSAPLPLDAAAAPGFDRVAAWREAVARVGTTSLHWFPLVRFAAPDSAGAACPLDDASWTGALVPALRTVAALAHGRPEPIAGVALELAPVDTVPPELCDSSLRAGLLRLGRDSAWIADLLARASGGRFEALLVSGLLGPYVAALETEIAARTAVVARAARRDAPELLFALWSEAPLADWRAFGLARGFGAPDHAAPVMLWDREPRPGPVLAAHRTRSVTPLHAVGLTPTGLPARAWSRLRTSVFTAHDGFWIGPLESFLAHPRGSTAAIPADSLARLVRRLSKGG